MTGRREAGRRVTTAAVAGAVACVVLLVAACGVSPEEEPQLIDQSTQHRPAATPSFDTETSPLPSTTTTTAPSSSVRSSPDEVPPPSG